MGASQRPPHPAPEANILNRVRNGGITKTSPSSSKIIPSSGPIIKVQDLLTADVPSVYRTRDVLPAKRLPLADAQGNATPFFVRSEKEQGFAPSDEIPMGKRESAAVKPEYPTPLQTLPLFSPPKAQPQAAKNASRGQRVEDSDARNSGMDAPGIADDVEESSEAPSEDEEDPDVINEKASAAHEASLARLSETHRLVEDWVFVVTECHTHHHQSFSATSVLGTFSELTDANAKALGYLKSMYGETWDEYEEEWDSDGYVRVEASGYNDESFEISVELVKLMRRVKKNQSSRTGRNV